ncbi:MAG TPA: prenyltransferase/squalene oxidase repeat-containing protein [Symbiobacteriaceae bacterium]|jgi:hypothetical protein|nr:prenyltransferase/squalene oxidase repeat-containing protein [Symbiobacteriaceae bacterium]
MEIPSAYELLLQRAHKCTDPTALDRAVDLLERVPVATLWDQMSQWRNGFIYVSLHHALGAHQVEPSVKRAVSEALLASQQPDGKWVDREALAKQDASPTAMAMLVLSLLDRSRYDDAINRAADWLLSQQGPEGAWVSDSTALDDILADTALAVRALTDCGRPDTEAAIKKASLFLNAFATDEFLSSDRCRPVNAFALSWLLDGDTFAHMPRTASYYLERLRSPAIVPSILETAQTLAVCLRTGASPFEPALQTVLGRLLLTQRPDGAWPGQEDRNAAYVTAHVIQCLPLIDHRVSLSTSAVDFSRYQEQLNENVQAEIGRIQDEADKKVRSCLYDKAILEERIRSLESERDLYHRRYLLHVENHEEQIRATGRLEAVEAELTRCREALGTEQKEAGRWQTYFWFVFAATVSIITGFVVNLFTARVP